jgi:hypothetical protein
MNAKYEGWSVDKHEGARISVKTRSASFPPKPSAVMVLPAACNNSSGVFA